MPWLPELFTAPVLAQIQEQRRREHLTSVPFFAGLLAGEIEALVGSFAGEPELHHPVRGRIRGVSAFQRYVGDMRTWLPERDATVEDVDLILTPRRGVEEVVVHFDDGDDRRVELPMALVTDHEDDGRIIEMRVYYSTWPATGRHSNRPPLVQPDPELLGLNTVSEYQHALAEGDVDAIVATFGPDGYAREPAGSDYVHRGSDALRGFYEQLFSNGGGIPLEHCALVDDERACALEYNVVRWGRTELPPQAGVAVYVRERSGKLAAVRIYDDADPPLGP
jgi:SnoaL-like domain